MRYRIPQSALTVIYNTLGQVLLMQRNDDPAFWQSVTGTLEAGELPIQTAKREVFEETGIDIDAKGYQLIDCQQTNRYEIRDRWKDRYPPNTPFNTEYVFALEVSADQEIILTEHSAYVWLDKSAAKQKAWSDTNSQAIELFVPKRPSGLSSHVSD
ncbi:dihydroneopterin triphosphate diphosphatase [Paraglaciecola aestuariivivens]